MTFSACLWLGVFPLLQGGTYSRITHDKWVIMLVLTCFTFLCFLFDVVSARGEVEVIIKDERPVAETKEEEIVNHDGDAAVDTGANDTDM